MKQNPYLYNIDLTLAQIALKKGDEFYKKGEYKKAINEYNKTIFQNYDLYYHYISPFIS